MAEVGSVVVDTAPFKMKGPHNRANLAAAARVFTGPGEKPIREMLAFANKGDPQLKDSHTPEPSPCPCQPVPIAFPSGTTRS